MMLALQSPAIRSGRPSSRATRGHCSGRLSGRPTADEKGTRMISPLNALAQLREFGQSPWCDHLSRELIDSKELTGLINGYGIVGFTSNPTIFQKSLSGGSSYDLQIARSAHRGHSVKEIYEEVATSDIQAV